MKIFFIIICILLASVVNAEFLGIKKSSESVIIRLDEVSFKPDSVHVMTYADNVAALVYAARSTIYPFAAVGIDTIKSYNDTAYYFSSVIADIDGTPSGNITLSIAVTLFAAGVPTTTSALVQVLDDSLNEKTNVWDATREDTALSLTVINGIKSNIAGTITTATNVTNGVTLLNSGLNNWVPITNADSLVIDFSSMLPKIVDTLESNGRLLWLIATHWGACDSCYTVEWPTGSSPKDSVGIFDKNNTLLYIIDFRAAVSGTLDTAITRRQ